MLTDSLCSLSFYRLSLIILFTLKREHKCKHGHEHEHEYAIIESIALADLCRLLIRTTYI